MFSDVVWNGRILYCLKYVPQVAKNSECSGASSTGLLAVTSTVCFIVDYQCTITMIQSLRNYAASLLSLNLSLVFILPLAPLTPPQSQLLIVDSQNKPHPREELK